MFSLLAVSLFTSLYDGKREATILHITSVRWWLQLPKVHVQILMLE